MLNSRKIATLSILVVLAGAFLIFSQAGIIGWGIIIILGGGAIWFGLASTDAFNGAETLRDSQNQDSSENTRGNLSRVGKGLQSIGGKIKDEKSRGQEAIREWRDERKKAKKLEEEIERLNQSDKNFEDAAKDLMQDKNLPEGAREEIGQIYKEFEKVEGEERNLLQIIEDIVKEEGIELEHLKDVEQIEEQIAEEEEEIAEEEQEVESTLTRFRRKVNEIQQEMRREEEKMEEAERRGNNKEAEKHRERIGQLENQAREILQNVENYRKKMMPEIKQRISKVKGWLGQGEGELEEVEQESQEVEGELQQAWRNAENLESEIEDEEGKAGDLEQIEPEMNNKEASEFEGIEEGVSAEEKTEQDEKSIAEEGTDEQENIEQAGSEEEDVLKEEGKELSFEDKVMSSELDEFRDIREKAESAIEEAERAKNESREAEQNLRQQIENQIAEIENTLEDIRAKNGQMDKAIPYYFVRVLDKTLKEIDRYMRNGEITEREAHALVQGTGNVARILENAFLRFSKSTDLFAAIQDKFQSDDKPHDKSQPSSIQGIERFRELENSSKPKEEVKQYLIEVRQKVKGRNFRTNAPIMELLRELDEQIDKSGGDPLNAAAQLFVIENMLRAIEESLDDSAIVERLNINVF